MFFYFFLFAHFFYHSIYFSIGNEEVKIHGVNQEAHSGQVDEDDAWKVIRWFSFALYYLLALPRVLFFYFLLIYVF